MKKPKFNASQEQWLTEQIDLWYQDWQSRITRDPRQPHNLGMAKEALKTQLFFIEPQEVCSKDDKTDSASIAKG